MQEAASAVPAPEFPSRLGIRPSVAATTILVVAADVLILSVRPGLGWFVFATSLAGVLAATAIGRNSRAALLALAIGILGALPLIEAPSFAAALVALAGLGAAALIAAGLSPRTMEAIPGVILRFVPQMPMRLPMDVVSTFGAGSGSNRGRALVGTLTGWIVPLVFVAIFLGLFLAANPMLDFVAQLGLGTLTVPDPLRIFLWLAFAAVIWSLVRPRLAALPATAKVEGDLPSAAAAGESRFFGRATIVRSLVVFNAIFAVQTLMDLAYLWGGAALPAGMTYADFAHRGAAPLIVTALLAAAFVLAAMRPNGPGMGSRLIRGLVYAWIGQNVLLCISAMMRLNLYVGAYTLTEFRVIAGIWMGLVAVGLVLILLRIALGKSNAWLIAANIASLTVAIYASALTDFPALIARFNVDHSLEVSGQGVALDISYFRDLGPGAIPALDRYIVHVPANEEARIVRAELIEDHALQASGDWRSWTFRSDRLAAYLDGTPATDDNQP